MSTPGASVVGRAFAVLGAFDEQHRSLTLSELSRRAALPLATTHRLVAELVGLGALDRHGAGRYTIGRRVWGIGLLAPVQTGLRELASPFLHDIFAATRATVHLAVRDGTEVLYLDRLSGSASVPIVSRVGTRLPLHCTGVGKVLLAHAPRDVVAEVLGSLRRVTPYTIVSADVLAAQLDRARRDGYATTADEMSIGASSVAVPVLRHGTEVVAALGIVVAQLRRDRRRLVAGLRVAAQGIGRVLDQAAAR
ncbi:IclR family transcriptional regulator [Dactylosporangium aurantiacum]|uniref:IclR family transcriptional regulator n=1 Tax=Dactylosporangium aurantiacum TaxID=35754 RepID=UPI001FDF9838|nr:IclR family transcriptional regulator [Dactylosporangium aurantiacum]MDG6107238.1 IclR family transcriptional regulator [Dactylosporangium aurantiacum]